MVLSVYLFIYSLSTPYGSLIRGMNRPDIAAKIGVLICTSNIILNYLFIPEKGVLATYGINGPTGAALATALSVVIGFFGLRIAAKKLTGIRLSKSRTHIHILAGLIMAGSLYLLVFYTSLFPVIRFYHLLMFVGLGLAIYLLVLYLFKEFKKDDLDFFLDIIHPKKMMKYMSSELKSKPPKK